MCAACITGETKSAKNASLKETISSPSQESAPRHGRSSHGVSNLYRFRRRRDDDEYDYDDDDHDDDNHDGDDYGEEEEEEEVCYFQIAYSFERT